MSHARYCWKSPLGWLVIALLPDKLLWLRFPRPEESLISIAPAKAYLPLLSQTKKELTEYFSGERKRFSLPYELSGTPFQMAVWQNLMAIPYGETVSYGKIAAAAGYPGAFRAVGTAIGQNPLSILIPCHRVIRKNGELGGYAGGLDKKRFLLELEMTVPFFLKE
ncbi:MAG TPA: methylated-DNA--[protein]-cysteine S-methyltransferase [Candidatus Marinimicrobia bacterium]|nr:methylated-DNA--[protein]-cysteine S-methyltransferase [Candidatus Neomarinimicrobiota bacterium]